MFFGHKFSVGIERKIPLNIVNLHRFILFTNSVHIHNYHCFVYCMDYKAIRYTNMKSFIFYTLMTTRPVICTYHNIMMMVGISLIYARQSVVCDNINCNVLLIVTKKLSDTHNTIHNIFYI